ncbi:Endoplasmic reticulum-Golgi intermediate compartment protein 3 [Linum grandiflorum]
MDAVVQKLRNLDAYPKINEDFYSRTLSGGVITVVSAFVMFLLFISEFSLYLHTVTETKLLVDTARGETLLINFNVTFPVIPCSLLSLDAMDISGEKHFDIRHDITKTRINSHGHVIEAKQSGIGAPTIEKPLQKHGGRLEHGETYCGSCFGAETSDDHCCNSCEEVQEAYRKKGWALTNADMIDQCKREGFIQQVNEEVGEGCNIHGSLEVNKVAGNFHFIPGKSFHQSNMFLHDLLAIEKDSYNVSDKNCSYCSRVQWMHDSPNGMHQYFIKVYIWSRMSHSFLLQVVPTIYTNTRGHTIRSNQYSVTEHMRHVDFIRSNSFPGVFFFYDLSPIKVVYKEEHISFLHFLTNICAVIGGIFTVAGIVDSFVYHGKKAIKKKVEIGKFR